MEASTLKQDAVAGLAAAGLSQSSDEGLVQLLRDGQQEAFQEIVERYRQRLFAFCRRMLGSTEDAEDVLQEVFANAYRAMLADEREINLKPWLYRIARNRCLNHLQRMKPVPEEQERLERIPIPEAAATHQRVENREEFRLLLGDVQGLPESQRRALLLCELDGLSYEQVGEEMTTTVPAVRSLLTRARTRLAEASKARSLTGLSPIALLTAARDFLLSKFGGGVGAAAGGSSGAAAGSAGGGLVSGLGVAGWATSSKIAAGAVAVAVAAGGTAEVVAPSHPVQAPRVAPVTTPAPTHEPAETPRQVRDAASPEPKAEAVPPSPFDRTGEVDAGSDPDATAEPWSAEPETGSDAAAPSEAWEQPASTVASPVAADEPFGR